MARRTTATKTWILLLAAAVLVPAATSDAQPHAVDISGSAVPLYPATLDEHPAIPSPLTPADETELLLATTADGHAAVLRVTVENGQDYVYGRGGKGRQLEVDGADFPTLARTGLHSEVELDRTRTITGRSTAQITEVGRPGLLSAAGFMAADEDIVSVLRGDNRLVRSLGLTHPQLARPLFHVWNSILVQLDAIRSEQRPWGDIVSVHYNQRAPGITWMTTRGWQESIFDDEIHGGCQIEISRPMDAAELSFLETTYPRLDRSRMEDLVETLTHLHIGEMAPFYIMRYGFYEGHTDYRADPVALALIFGLRDIEEIEAVFPGRLPEVMSKHFGREARRGSTP